MEKNDRSDHSAQRRAASPARGGSFRKRRLYLQLLTIFAVALAFCLGISVFFKVDTITVSGAQRYTPWTVAEASGVREGDNLLFFGRAGAMVKIKQALPYVKNVRIGIILPGTVNIVIEEAQVVYAIKDSGGAWWLITSDGVVTEQVNAASAGACTAIEGVTLDAPQVGQTAVAAEKETPTDATGIQSDPALRNADRLQAALQIAQALEQNEVLGEAASIHVESLQELLVWYGDRYEVNLGDSTLLAEKIAAMCAAIEQMGQFQTGKLEVLQTDGKWQVLYRQE